MPLKELALNGTLKSSESSEASSTGTLLELIAEEFKQHGVETETIRLADHNIKPAVTSDEGEGDAWRDIRKKVVEADALLIGTPFWLGQPGSICKRVLGRKDAFLEEIDDRGRMVSYGKVAAVAVVGNGYGAHHASAEVFQALSDVSFTIPANAVACWVGEAMGSTNFVDPKKTPEAVQTMISMLAGNTAHPAKLLNQSENPEEEG
jgi:multimeric flavodoxin WrbA